MAKEHTVWAIPRGGDEPEPFASYEPERWQWAEKLAQFLRDKGYRDVEVLFEEARDE